MFSGTTYQSIDSKGRIILPTKFREELGENFYITNGFNGCLQILSKNEFDHIREQIKQLPASKCMSLQYIMISPAVEATVNSQGRVLIPQALRKSARLQKEVVVIGMDTRIEVWDQTEFEQFIEKQKAEALNEALELLRL